MSSEHISNLSLNPFFCSKLIQHFISGHGNKLDLHRIYLVLPYILYEPSRKVLASANRNSNIYTLFLENEKVINLGGIERRYKMYKELSNQSIITAINEGLIDFANGHEIHLVKKCFYQREKDELLKEYFRSAFYLGIIFSNYRTLDILIKSGVKEL